MCALQYTLYPDALVPQLIQEVSAAMDWALHNVAAYGGDVNQVCACVCVPMCILSNSKDTEN